MATTADFKNGLCIVHNNEIWSIVEFLHVKPGKGNTFVRTKLKNLKNGRVQEFRFDAGIKIDLARVERRLRRGDLPVEVEEYRDLDHIDAVTRESIKKLPDESAEEQ